MLRVMRSLVDTAARSLFGRDVFISYARRDAIGYARQLATAIRVQRRVSICIDQWAAPPYATTHPALLRELRRSSLLVLVASESAVLSSNVAVELMVFGQTGRNILPIDVGGALQRSAWAPGALEALRGTVSEREDLAALAAGEPSVSVVGRIVEAIDFETQTQRIRRFARRTVVGVLLMVGAATAFSWWRISGADRLRESAEADAIKAGSRAVLARRSEADARALEARSRSAAAQASARAKAETRRAETEQERAAAATAEAGRQQELALALRLANESATVLRQQPEMVGRATLLAAVAAKHLTRLGVRSLSVETALREAVALLPVIDHTFVIPAEDYGTQALSADGRFLAVIRDDSTIELCATQSSRCTRLKPSGRPTKKLHQDLVFSPDSHAVGASFDKKGGGASVLVWSTETGRLQGSEIELPSQPSGISVAPGGEWLAAGTPEGVALFQLREHSDLVRTFPIPHGYPCGWSSTADPLLLTLGKDDVRVWSPDSGEPRAVLKTKSAPLDAVLSPDGSLVATTDETQGLAVWDWRRSPQQPLWTLQAKTALRDPQFSPNGALVATSGIDEGVRVFETAGGRTIGFFEGGNQFAFNADGSLLLTSALSIARLWRLPDGRELARQQALGEPPVAFLADGRAVTGEAGDALNIWHANPATRPESPISVGGGVHLVMPIPHSNDLLVSAFSDSPPTTAISRLSPDGTSHPCFTTPGEIKVLFVDESGRVLTGSKEGRVMLWTAACSGKPRLQGEFEMGSPINAVVLRGSILALAFGKYTFIRKGGITQPMSHPKPVDSMTISADGRTLFTSADDGRVRVWDLVSNPPRVVRSFSGRRGSTRLVLDPSGRYLASAGVLSGADVWDLHRSDEKQVCVIRPDWINNVVGFDPSGRFLLTGGADRILSLWIGWEHGAPQAVFRQKLSSGIRGAVFSSDGKRLVAIGDDPRPTMLQTLWQPDDLLRIACELARPSFSKEEWHYVLPGVAYEPPCR